MPHLRYALLGAAGYIAPRHLDAIAATGGVLVAAADPHDSVGVLDRHFPDAAFFPGYAADERLFKALASGDLGKVDRVVICTPNDLHGAQTLEVLNLGCDVICEKPLGMDPDEVRRIERATVASGRKVWTVVQLRHLPRIMDLRSKWLHGSGGRHKVTVKYITRRGPWYDASWKGDAVCSGGPVLNLGIHFIDLMTWCFGPAQSAHTEFLTGRRGKGTLTLERAEVDWFLSSDPADLPIDSLERATDTAFRRVTVDGHEVDLNPNFVAGTHVTVYHSINTGNGFGPADVLPGIEAASMILDSADRRQRAG